MNYVRPFAMIREKVLISFTFCNTDVPGSQYDRNGNRRNKDVSLG